MSNNKKIEFDMLENADINTIEKIGTDNMNIDKSAHDRMLKNAMQKYQKEKQQLDMTSVNSAAINDDYDSVTGVETYNRKKICHIAYAALSSAAALVLIGGSVLMMNRHKHTVPDAPEPKTVATTTVSGTAVVSTTDVSSAKTTDQNTTSTAAKAVTVVSEITTANADKSENTTPTVTTQANNINYGNDLWSYKNPHTDRKDISSEELEAAKNRAMDKFMHDGICYNVDGTEQFLSYPVRDIYNATFDVNNDGIPELFISGETISSHNTYMYVYDGNEYIQAKLNYHTWEGTATSNFVVAGTIYVCPEKNLIYMWTKEGYEFLQIVEVSHDNTFTTLDEFNYSGYYKDGETIIERNNENFYDNSAFEAFKSNCDKFTWQQPEYTFYAEENDAAIKFIQEQQALSNSYQSSQDQ